MYTLRDYQNHAVNAGLDGLTKYGKPFIIQAATGAGKSLMIAELCHQLDEPVLILQPSKELLEQNYSKLESYGVTDISMYSASVGQKVISKYTYATIASIYRKPELFAHFKYVIIDECHQVNPKNLEGMYTKFLKAIGCTRVCGLTATPYRNDQKYYTDQWGQVFYTAHLKMINRMYPYFFKKIVYKIETQELIDQGYLSPIDYFQEKQDTSELKVNTTGAEYTDKSVENFWNDHRIKRIADGAQYVNEKHKLNLIFCSSIRQGERVTAALKHLGLLAEMVTGETKKDEREQIVSDFRQQKIKHLVNVGVFTTGFDVPELDSIMLARPTMSLALYYQMVGRGVRIDPTAPDKRLAVYDFAGMVERMGRVENIRIQTEEGGFRDEVWTERGRYDDQPLFTFLVKNKSKHHI